MRYGRELMRDMRRDCKAVDSEWNQKHLLMLSADPTNDELADTIVRNNMAYILHIVGRYMRGLPHLDYLRDDLTSAGYLGLCKGVARVRKGTQITNAAAFLSYAIRREILRLLKSEQKAHPPSTTVDSDEVSRYCVEDADLALIEVRDTVASCCETELEREVVRLRGTHHLTLDEISHRLNITYRSVKYLLARIYEKFNQRPTV